MKFVTTKRISVKAITFDGLVEHGRANGANIVNGMPWSFDYLGMPVSHENDDCYLVNPPNAATVQVHRGDTLYVWEET